jgi:hypothetical protein
LRVALSLGIIRRQGGIKKRKEGRKKLGIHRWVHLSAEKKKKRKRKTRCPRTII